MSTHTDELKGTQRASAQAQHGEFVSVGAGVLLALVVIAALSLTVSGCLDARNGQLGDAANGPAGAGGACGQATALNEAGASVRGLVMSPCGTAAWYEETWDQPTLQVRSPTGDRWPAINVDGNGWHERTAIAADGTRVAVALGQSDLGFGTTFVYERGNPDPVSELGYGSGGSIGFSAGRAWSCEPDLNYQVHVSLETDGDPLRLEVTGCERLVASPSRLVVASMTEGQVTISDARGVRTLAIADFVGGRHHGDTLYLQHAIRLSPDGQRLFTQNVSYSVFGHEDRTYGPLLVIDLNTDKVIAELDAEITGLVLARSGHAFAAPTGDADTLWVAADGTTTLIEGLTPTDVTEAGHVVGLDPGTGLLTLVDPNGKRHERVADPDVKRSRDGRIFALSYADATCELPGSTSTSTPDPGCATHSVGVWSGDEVSWLRRGQKTQPTIHWVGADGAVVLSEQLDSLTIEVSAFSATGDMVWQRETSEVGRVTGADGRSLIAVAGGPAQQLFVVDTATGAARQLFGGHNFQANLAADAPVVGLVYGPQSGTDNALQVGAMPRP